MSVMAALTLPSMGSVYADGQILIYRVEKHPDYALLLLTNDNGFRRIPGLSCVILNNVLNSS